MKNFVICYTSLKNRGEVLFKARNQDGAVRAFQREFRNATVTRVYVI